MQTLYLIGNGFDVAHGLKTQYWEFREYILKNSNNFLLRFEEIYGIQPLDDTEPWYRAEMEESWKKSVNHHLWSAFEKYIGAPDFEQMLSNSKTASEGMPQYGIRGTMNAYWEEHYGFIKELEQLLKDWVNSIDTSSVICKKRELLNSDDIFFTFNYTDVLEKVYCADKVLHIHGGVDTICSTPPIMGHCNKKDIEQYRAWAKEADEEFEEAEASIHEAVSDYLNRTFKDTKSLIRGKENFFTSLSEINRVVTIGWSSGDVDIPYLMEIRKNISQNAKWEVYFYEDESLQALKSALEGLINLNAENIQYFSSASFWDQVHIHCISITPKPRIFKV